MDERKEASAFESLMQRYGKNLDDLRSSKETKASQMEKFEQGNYGAVRLSTIAAVTNLLGCSTLEALNAFASKPNT